MVSQPKKTRSGPRAKKKGPSVSMSLTEIQPLTQSQSIVFDAYGRGSHVVMTGSAGTGKTFLACYLASRSVMSGEYSRIVLVRSAVPTRSVGFLKGDLDEKTAVYEAPYRKIFNDVFSRGDAYDQLKTKGIVDFITSSYIRGITIDDAVVIVDETENFNFHELDSIITRLGDNTRLIMCGDYKQSDFTRIEDKRGLKKFQNIIDTLSQFECIEFFPRDIVRGDLVKSYIIARENHESVQREDEESGTKFKEKPPAFLVGSVGTTV